VLCGRPPRVCGRLSLICSIVFLALVCVYAFIFIDSNPLSPGNDGCTSGHAAVLMLLWKVRRPRLGQILSDGVSNPRLLLPPPNCQAVMIFLVQILG